MHWQQFVFNAANVFLATRCCRECRAKECRARKGGRVETSYVLSVDESAEYMKAQRARDGARSLKRISVSGIASGSRFANDDKASQSTQ